ncbi:MAG: glutaredoxin family protein [Lysobacterales bacterium]|jgi:glutaredoxin
MTGDRSLVLYTRPGCHLCEQAAALLEREGVLFEEVDIETEPELERLYGLRVPVLKHPGSNLELDYPFGVDDALQLADSPL